MDIAQRVMLLRKVNLFSSLPGETLVTVAESCETREVVAGETIFEAGDPPDGLYVLAAGDIKIVKGDKTLARLSPGDFFGEIALVDDAPRIAAAVARSDGLMLFIDREVFRRLTEDLPQVLRAVIRTLIVSEPSPSPAATLRFKAMGWSSWPTTLRTSGAKNSLNTSWASAGASMASRLAATVR